MWTLATARGVLGLYVQSISVEYSHQPTGGFPASTGQLDMGSCGHQPECLKQFPGARVGHKELTLQILHFCAHCGLLLWTLRTDVLEAGHHFSNLYQLKQLKKLQEDVHKIGQLYEQSKNMGTEIEIIKINPIKYFF